MPSDMRWFDDEKTIAYQRVYGRWTVREALQALVDGGKTMLNEHTPIPYYFIVDLLEAEGVPSGLLSKQQQITEITTNDSFTVIVGAHDIIRIFIESMQRLGFNRQFMFVDTLDDALARIDAHRSRQQEV